MCIVLFYGIINFIFDFPVGKNLCPFSLFVRAVYVTGIIFRFYNKYTVWVDQDVIDLAGHTFIYNFIIIEYIA